jgi:hypothetical protein
LFFSTFHQGGRHAEFISASFQLQKGIYFEKALIKQTLSFRSLPRGMVLWGAKVPKAPCQSGNVAPHHPRTSKNSGTLFCVQFS